ACVLTLATIMIADVRNFYYMVYILTGWFAVTGNGVIMIRLTRRNHGLIGGTLAHIGFGLMLLSILASSAYNQNLVDDATKRYNAAVKRGEVFDKQGFKVMQTVNFLELKLNEPKIINDEYKVTYKGYTLKNQARPGQQ